MVFLFTPKNDGSHEIVAMFKSDYLACRALGQLVGNGPVRVSKGFTYTPKIGGKGVITTHSIQDCFVSSTVEKNQVDAYDNMAVDFLKKAKIID